MLNVHSGAVLASAGAAVQSSSLRRFGQRGGRVTFVDTAHPLFDRVCRMAIPPGSVFKARAAVALWSGLDPDVPYYCQGYLEHPDRLRS